MIHVILCTRSRTLRHWWEASGDSRSLHIAKAEHMNSPTTHFSGPIFLCGTSRSGTSVLQAALECHTAVRIAGETHYFDDLRVALGTPALSEPVEGATQKRVEDYFLALSHRPFGHGGDPEKGWMQRDALRKRALELGGRPDDYFEAFCREWAARSEAPIWGEKTPRHVFRLTEMLTRYPESKAIFMLRDPRAVVASYRDWKNQGGFDLEKDPGHAQTMAEDEARARRSYHPITISLLWVAAARAAQQAQDRFGFERVRLQRYEAMCDQPEAELGAIFDWLGIERPASMANVPVRNSSYEKFAATGGFVRSAMDRWMKTLSPAEISVVERSCGKSLALAGYQSASPAASILATTPYYCSALPAVIRATFVNAKRSGNLPQYIARRSRLILGL